LPRSMGIPRARVRQPQTLSEPKQEPIFLLRRGRWGSVEGMLRTPRALAGGVFRIHLTNLSYHPPIEAGPDAKLKQPRFLGQHPPGFFVLFGIPDSCFARCEHHRQADPMQV